MSFEDSLNDLSVRRFSGYVCLKAQVGDLSKVYGRTAVNTVWKKWAMARIAQKKPHVGIVIGYTEDSLSSIDSAEYEFSEDPVLRVTGELNSSHEGMSDEEVIETLKSLFCTLAKALKQTQADFKFYGDDDKYMCKYNISYRSRTGDRFEA
ncbi:expressed unknown protein [Seminavis robusta]|uniref:Uncharacterized protein n=1 Tax=Seminavis robusta TaxID=568900 RepID=A0A9N8DUX8_9STRA|nr:expressed unknown protein [Seminavis robusta]|eukprot:Sro295_g110340.1 n/a (151) ;mRNA; r:12377-12829